MTFRNAYFTRAQWTLQRQRGEFKRGLKAEEVPERHNGVEIAFRQDFKRHNVRRLVERMLRRKEHLPHKMMPRSGKYESDPRNILHIAAHQRPRKLRDFRSVGTRRFCNVCALNSTDCTFVTTCKSTVVANFLIHTKSILTKKIIHHGIAT